MKDTAVKNLSRRAKHSTTSVANGIRKAESVTRTRKATSPKERLRARLRATIPDLREYYQLGVELVGVSRERLKYSENTAFTRAEMLGKTQDYVEKACQLARMYETPESFETLLKHLEAMSNKHSFALSRSHVMATLLLVTKRERKVFLTRAAEHCWSADCLRDEIRSARPVKSKGGRARRLPKTRGQLLIEASGVCRHLIDLRDKLEDHKLKLPDEAWKELIAFQKRCDRKLEKLREPQ